MLQTRRSEAYFSPGTDIKVDFSQITSNQLDTTRDTKYNMNGGDNPMSKWEKQSKESCPYPRTYDSMNCVRY